MSFSFFFLQKNKTKKTMASKHQNTFLDYFLFLQNHHRQCVVTLYTDQAQTPLHRNHQISLFFHLLRFNPALKRVRTTDMIHSFFLNGSKHCTDSADLSLKYLFLVLYKQPVEMRWLKSRQLCETLAQMNIITYSWILLLCSEHSCKIHPRFAVSTKHDNCTLALWSFSLLHHFHLCTSDLAVFQWCNCLCLC